MRPVYLVDGARTPFLKARGVPGPFSASDLAVQAGRALLLRQPFEPQDLGEVIIGCAAPAPDEVNIGRLVALRLGCGDHVPGFTVMRNCASGMQALDSARLNIGLGTSELVLAGGTDALSRAAVLFSDGMVHWLARWNAARTPMQKAALLTRFKLRDLAPVIGLLKGLTDPTVGLSMGQTAEELACRFGISRQAMDAYAVESHRRAMVAQAGDPHRVPLMDAKGKGHALDDGVRADANVEKLATLRPVFDKPYGHITAGNSSQVTDGAALLLLASEDALARWQLKPLARLVDCQWAALSPAVMGLGPVHAATPLLERHHLALQDLDTVEINEAFAAQVLACLAAWQDVAWCRQELGREPLGAIDPARLNPYGGAIAVGHPVGASGARIVLEVLRALRERGGRHGLASICIGGGQGGAMLIEALSWNAPALRHWRLERDPDAIAWAVLDRAGESANALSGEVMAELKLLLDHLDAEPPKGLVFRSAKAAGFIAGADVHEFETLVTPEQGEALVRRGWDLFSRIAALPYPTLALIRGHCLGGGLELSLACRHRVAVDEAQTRLGLPEVLLGIVPAWGGMQRLPRRIGPAAALDLMLTGKTVDARRALRLGLVDACVPARLMMEAARRRVLDPAPSREPPLLQRLLNGPLKALAARQARAQVARKARRDQYPAPYVLIDLWQRHDGDALAGASLLQQVLASPTTRNLIRVFHLQDRLKRFAKDSAFKARRVHVVGAGVMGGDIAAWCALQGFTVTLQDQSLERLEPAFARAETLFARRLKSASAARAARDRLVPDLEGAGVPHADVVIEAIVEQLPAKQQLFAALEGRLKPGALLATNTSSLSLEDIAQALKAPERLVGIHFFNPVAQMMLVEVVHKADTPPAIARDAAAFVGALGKLPLPVQSAPGFLVNAVLAPYMREALACLDEGVAPEALDAALEAWGMPMGPVELMDTVGLDIVRAVGEQLTPGVPAECLEARLREGRLGKKSGRGFYAWERGKAQKPKAGAVPAGLAARLVTPLAARAAVLVNDGVVADADLADAGIIFGTGFAPFRGGPLHARKTGTLE